LSNEIHIIQEHGAGIDTHHTPKNGR